MRDIEMTPLRLLLIAISLGLFGLATYHFYIAVTMSPLAVAEACEGFDNATHEKGCFPELGHFLFGFIFLGPAVITCIITLARGKKSSSRS